MSKVKINEYYQKIKENGYDIEVRQDTNAHLNRVYLLKDKKRVIGDDGNYIYNKFYNNRNANISVDNMKHTYSNSHKEQALKELLEDIKEIKEKNDIRPKKKSKMKP